MADDDPDPEFSPPPFSFALLGHLATGMVKATAIALLLWLVGLTGWIAAYSVGAAILTAVIVMLVAELVTTLVERIFVLRHEHPDPGSVPMTVIDAVLPLPIGFAVGLLTGPSPNRGVVTMGVTAVVYWTVLVTLDRPWVEGDSREDIRRKIEETRTMTREVFGPE